MPSPTDTECQQLRMRIARSRRRLDRHAQQLMSGSTSWLPFGPQSNRNTSSRANGRTLLLTAVAGFAFSRWGLDTESFQRWRQQLLGQTVSTWIDRIIRRIRVAAWQARRSSNSETTEVTDA